MQFALMFGFGVGFILLAKHSVFIKMVQFYLARVYCIDIFRN
jgi:hypothetical protein